MLDHHAAAAPALRRPPGAAQPPRHRLHRPPARRPGPAPRLPRRRAPAGPRHRRPERAGPVPLERGGAVQPSRTGSPTGPATRHGEFLQRVAEGRISLSAMPFNLHTEMCSTDELHELLRPALDLQQRYGAATSASAMQTDVPGHVVGLPDALGRTRRPLPQRRPQLGRPLRPRRPRPAGHAPAVPLARARGRRGRRLAHRHPARPRLHGRARWSGLHEYYDVTSDVFGAYLASLGTRPYPLPVGSIFGWLDGGADVEERPPFAWDVLHLRTHGRWSDNAGPSRAVSDIVEEWNSRWVFPRLRVSTNEAFFDDAVERLGDAAPTHTGDWNDWWAHGVGSATAAPSASARQAQNDLADAQTLGAAARLLDPAAPAAARSSTPTRATASWPCGTSTPGGRRTPGSTPTTGPSAGEHQWYWKVARAYAALDASDRALQLGRRRARPPRCPGAATRCVSALRVQHHRVRPHRRASSSSCRPAWSPLTRPIVVIDARTGEALPHTERPEQAGSRGAGPLPDLPGRRRAAGRLRPARPRPADARTGRRRCRWPTRPGWRTSTSSVPSTSPPARCASVVDRATGRELVDSDGARSGSTTTSTTATPPSGQLQPQLLEVRRRRQPGADQQPRRRPARRPWSRRRQDARGQQVVLRPAGRGRGVAARSPTGCPAGLAHLEITNRLAKASTWDKESAFFAFPFALPSSRPCCRSRPAGSPGPGRRRCRVGRSTCARSGTSSRSATATGRRLGHGRGPAGRGRDLALPYVPFPRRCR